MVHNRIILEYLQIFFNFFHKIFFLWRKVFFEHFNISENNIISVKFVEVLLYAM
jgi:hypothetical protein